MHRDGSSIVAISCLVEKGRAKYWLNVLARRCKIIIAEWTDPRTHTTYQFRSYAPLSVNVKLGESVDVLIDPDNPERYTITSVESISMKRR